MRRRAFIVLAATLIAAGAAATWWRLHDSRDHDRDLFDAFVPPDLCAEQPCQVTNCQRHAPRGLSCDLAWGRPGRPAHLDVAASGSPMTYHASYQMSWDSDTWSAARGLVPQVVERLLGHAGRLDDPSRRQLAAELTPKLLECGDEDAHWLSYSSLPRGFAQLSCLGTFLSVLISLDRPPEGPGVPWQPRTEVRLYAKTALWDNAVPRDLCDDPRAGCRLEECREDPPFSAYECQLYGDTPALRGNLHVIHEAGRPEPYLIRHVARPTPATWQRASDSTAVIADRLLVDNGGASDAERAETRAAILELGAQCAAGNDLERDGNMPGRSRRVELPGGHVVFGCTRENSQLWIYLTALRPARAGTVGHHD